MNGRAPGTRDGRELSLRTGGLALVLTLALAGLSAHAAAEPSLVDDREESSAETADASDTSRANRVRPYLATHAVNRKRPIDRLDFFSVKGPAPTPTPTLAAIETPTNVPASSTETCEDAGYSILDAFGGRHTVGGSFPIMGNLYYGRDVAADMERALSEVADKGLAAEDDLAVLDRFGAVQFVANPGSAPPQSFYWPEGGAPAHGYAVDIEMAGDN